MEARVTPPVSKVKERRERFRLRGVCVGADCLGEDCAGRDCAGKDCVGRAWRR